MPALIATTFTAEIVWLGTVADRSVTLRSAAQSAVAVTYAGFDGDGHAGMTRRSCARVTGLYPRGTEIRNVRQISILSEEELAATAADLGMGRIDPAWVGASMVVRGIPDFTRVPPASRLQADNGTVLTIDMENLPCSFTARQIEAEKDGAGKAYKAAARRRRGVTAWVEREGGLKVGDTLRLHIPNQPRWGHETAARSPRR